MGVISITWSSATVATVSSELSLATCTTSLPLSHLPFSNFLSSLPFLSQLALVSIDFYVPDLVLLLSLCSYLVMLKSARLILSDASQHSLEICVVLRSSKFHYKC